MLKKMRLLLLVAPLALSACGAVTPSTTLALTLLPDGSSVGGVEWRNSGMTMSSTTTVAFRCSGDKIKCAILSAGTLAGAGHEAVLGALVQGSVGAIVGASLLPKPTSGAFISAPQTFVQTNVGRTN